MPRNVSGIYFRYKNSETGKYENWCFEDLPEDVQRSIILDRNVEWKDNMIIALAKVIKDVCEQFDIANATETL